MCKRWPKTSIIQKKCNADRTCKTLNTSKCRSSKNSNIKNYPWKRNTNKWMNLSIQLLKSHPSMLVASASTSWKVNNFSSSRMSNNQLPKFNRRSSWNRLKEQFSTRSMKKRPTRSLKNSKWSWWRNDSSKSSIDRYGRIRLHSIAFIKNSICEQDNCHFILFTKGFFIKKL